MQKTVLFVTDSAPYKPYEANFPFARSFVEEGFKVGIIDKADPANAAFFDADAAFDIDAPLRVRVVDGAYSYATKDSGTHVSMPASAAQLFMMRLPSTSDERLYRKMAGLERIAPVINPVDGILKHRSKAQLVHYKGVIDAHLAAFDLCRSVDEVRAFQSATGGEIVVKEIVSNGGAGVHRMDGASVASAESGKLLQEIIVRDGAVLCMEFLIPPNGGQSDNRTVVFNGEIMGVLERKNEKNWLHNVKQGATFRPVEATPEEKAIVEALTPILAADGVLFFGIDTLVGSDGKRKLSEVNVGDIGCIGEHESVADYRLTLKMVRAIRRVLEKGGHSPTPKH